LGAVARYGINQLFVAQGGSPIWATFFANISGSFILGFIVGFVSTHPTWSLESRMFISVGFLGSYTTFSTLSLTTIQSLQKGDIYSAIFNIGASISIGCAAAFIGIVLGKFISG